MPDEIKYAANNTPPAFTNNADWTIEPGTHVRVKIIGTRTEVGEMWAIGSINGDFLGYDLAHDLPVLSRLCLANTLYQMSPGRLRNVKLDLYGRTPRRSVTSVSAWVWLCLYGTYNEPIPPLA